ncbi:50S ribosomal protein L24 [Candidatus Micrarchaeota archaeon]|nr:50S ribosomal protein L24 [Candidatus Micrarchaeota archaeon]
MKRTSSKKPRKQRKFRAKADLHLRKNFLKVHISKELKKKLATKKRTILVRKGDKVRFISGSHKGYTGKVINVDYKRLKLFIEGISKVNSKGNDKPIPIDPSNVELIDGNFEKNRLKTLNR